jgi:hypothetical protein
MGRKSLFRKFRRSDFGRHVTTGVSVGFLKSLAASLRYTWIDRSHLERLYAEGKTFIFAYWHSDLVLVLRIGLEELARNPIVVMASRSRDGLLVAELLSRGGLNVVRASSGRGAMQGMRDFAKNLRAGQNGSMAVDGPKGPRREVKHGIIRLAQMEGVPILPCAVGYQRKFVLNTWDRLRMPYPFSKAAAICGEPIYYGKDLSKDRTTEAADELAKVLNDLRHSLPYDCD